MYLRPRLSQSQLPGWNELILAWLLHICSGIVDVAVWPCVAPCGLRARTVAVCCIQNWLAFGWSVGACGEFLKSRVSALVWRERACHFRSRDMLCSLSSVALIGAVSWRPCEQLAKSVSELNVKMIDGVSCSKVTNTHSRVITFPQIIEAVADSRRDGHWRL